MLSKMHRDAQEENSTGCNILQLPRLPWACLTQTSVKSDLGWRSHSSESSSPLGTCSGRGSAWAAGMQRFWPQDPPGRSGTAATAQTSEGRKLMSGHLHLISSCVSYQFNFWKRSVGINSHQLSRESAWRPGEQRASDPGRLSVQEHSALGEEWTFAQRGPHFPLISVHETTVGSTKC